LLAPRISVSKRKPQPVPTLLVTASYTKVLGRFLAARLIRQAGTSSAMLTLPAVDHECLEVRAAHLKCGRGRLERLAADVIRSGPEPTERRSC